LGDVAGGSALAAAAQAASRRRLGPGRGCGGLTKGRVGRDHDLGAGDRVITTRQLVEDPLPHRLQFGRGGAVGRIDQVIGELHFHRLAGQAHQPSGIDIGAHQRRRRQRHTQSRQGRFDRQHRMIEMRSFAPIDDVVDAGRLQPHLPARERLVLIAAVVMEQGHRLEKPRQIAGFVAGDQRRAADREQAVAQKLLRGQPRIAAAAIANRQIDPVALEIGQIGTGLDVHLDPRMTRHEAAQARQ